MEITEESKALLEEYNKTVSFLLSRVLSPFLFLALALPSHPNQPLYSPAPPPFRQVQKSLHSLFQTPVLTLTFNQTMLLSKQFVQWDELLCQLEAAKQVKPAEE